MADVATPSGAAMFDGGNVSEKKPTPTTKPEKPDEEAFKANLKKAEKEHSDVMAKLQAVRAKIDLAKGSGPKNSPASKRRGELIAQLKEIREQQGAGKDGRKQTFDKISRLDEQVKAEQAAQKVARSRVAYKNVAEVDAEIASLDKEVNTGMMKMVDEKKALAQISNLRKQRKNFGGFDDTQKSIDAKKAQLKQLRDTLDDPESKALSEKYSKIQGELDVIKAEQEEASKSVDSLYDERKKLDEQQKETYRVKKQVQDDYYGAKRAVDNYEYKARQAFRERKKAEQETFVKEKKRARAQDMLAEASEKAYLDEIRTAESVLRFLDPKYQGTEKTPLQAPSSFSAQASRTIDDAGIKGMKVVRKEEEDYFAGTGGKKGKKGKKNNAAATPESPAVGKYKCPPQVIADCSTMGIDPPMSAADIPSVTEKVRAKLNFYKSDQAAQTERNIAKAKKELERLEAEDSAPATPTTKETNGAHGETKATAGVDDGGSIKNEIELIKGAVADVVADVTGAKSEEVKE